MSYISKFSGRQTVSGDKVLSRALAVGDKVLGSIFNPLLAWDESTESAVANADTYCVVMENTSAGGSEVGLGLGLSEANRTLTSTGSVPGATGSPLTRAISAGGGQRLDWTYPALETVLLASSWTVMWKLYDWSSTTHQWCDFYDSGTSDYIDILRSGATSRAQIYARFGATTIWNNDDIGTDACPTTGAVYIAVWKDGSYLRAGWKTSMFTKWSDLASTQRVSSATLPTFTQFRTRYSVVGSAGAVTPVCKLRWFLAAKKLLITND